jgi:serine/threonine protein kinase
MKLFGFKQNVTNNLHERYARGQSLWKLPSITVHEATQKASGRSVYLWLYDEKVKPGSEEHELFGQRIKATLSLKIPMLRILDYGVDQNGTAFVITELGDNICLSRITIPAERIPPTFYAIVKIVTRLHAKGLYLGTICPELFSVDSGGKLYMQAPLFLFHNLAHTSLNEHTESFIAPELKTGKEATSTSDSYSLGALLYFMMNRNYLRMANNCRQHNEYVEKYLPSFLLSRFKKISWAVDLLLDCLKWETERRPRSAEEIFERMKSHMPVAQKTIQSMVPLFEWRNLGTIILEVFATRAVAGTLACFGLLFFISAGDIFNNSSASDPLAKTFSSAVAKKENKIPKEKFDFLKRQDLEFGEPINGFAAVHELEKQRDKSLDPENQIDENAKLEQNIKLLSAREQSPDDKAIDEREKSRKILVTSQLDVDKTTSVKPSIIEARKNETKEVRPASKSKDIGRFVSKVPYIEEQFTPVESMISHLIHHKFPDVPDRAWCKKLELDYTPIDSGDE